MSNNQASQDASATQQRIQDLARRFAEKGFDPCRDLAGVAPIVPFRTVDLEFIAERDDDAQPKPSAIILATKTPEERDTYMNDVHEREKTPLWQTVPWHPPAIPSVGLTIETLTAGYDLPDWLREELAFELDHVFCGEFIAAGTFCRFTTEVSLRQRHDLRKALRQRISRNQGNRALDLKQLVGNHSREAEKIRQHTCQLFASLDEGCWNLVRNAFKQLLGRLNEAHLDYLEDPEDIAAQLVIEDRERLESLHQLLNLCDQSPELAAENMSHLDHEIFQTRERRGFSQPLVVEAEPVMRISFRDRLGVLLSTYPNLAWAVGLV